MILRIVFVWVILVLFLVYLFSDKLCVITGLFKKSPEFGLKERLAGIIDDENTVGKEGDFMTTKKGKVLLMLCIVLLLYAIVSTICIVRLNSKINSVYEITQEIKEQL